MRIGFGYVLVIPKEGVFLLTDLDRASAVLLTSLALPYLHLQVTLLMLLQNAIVPVYSNCAANCPCIFLSPDLKHT